MKKLVIVLAVIVLAAGLLIFNPVRADVTEELNPIGTQVIERAAYKKIDLTLYPGDRIIIIRAGTTNVYTKITPTECRVYDEKVPEGKIWTGILEEKVK